MESDGRYRQSVGATSEDPWSMAISRLNNMQNDDSWGSRAMLSDGTWPSCPAVPSPRRSMNRDKLWVSESSMPIDDNMEFGAPAM